MKQDKYGVCSVSAGQKFTYIIDLTILFEGYDKYDITNICSEFMHDCMAKKMKEFIQKGAPEYKVELIHQINKNVIRVKFKDCP